MKFMQYISGVIYVACVVFTQWVSIYHHAPPSPAVSPQHWSVNNSLTLQGSNTRKYKEHSEFWLVNSMEDRHRLRDNIKTDMKLPTRNSSWLQIQRSGFDSHRYQIFCVVVGLERGPLCLVSAIEDLTE
jgi:hypothetical protein